MDQQDDLPQWLAVSGSTLVRVLHQQINEICHFPIQVGCQLQEVPWSSLTLSQYIQRFSTFASLGNCLQGFRIGLFFPVLTSSCAPNNLFCSKTIRNLSAWGKTLSWSWSYFSTLAHAREQVLIPGSSVRLPLAGSATCSAPMGRVRLMSLSITDSGEMLISSEGSTIQSYSVARRMLAYGALRVGDIRCCGPCPTEEHLEIWSAGLFAPASSSELGFFYIFTPLN